MGAISRKKLGAILESRPVSELFILHFDLMGNSKSALIASILKFSADALEKAMWNSLHWQFSVKEQ